MYWPGATAAAAGRAGFEAESALEPGRSGAGMAASAAPLTSEAAVRAAPSPAVIPAPRSNRDLACMEDPELFFAESPDDVEDAKALCRGCPARISCLSGALERAEPWGVWGGELVLRGEVVPRKRPRGRPRKTDVAA